MNKDYGFREKGKNVEIYEPISFVYPHNITIMNHVRLSEMSLISGGKELHIGNFVHIANHVSIIGGGRCIIEDFVGVCAGVRLITGSDDIRGEGIPSPMVSLNYRSFYQSHIYLKKHSFIGTNVIVHPGVTIGEGVVVASGSIVTKDLDPWGVYMGTPAKRVKDRRMDTIESMTEKIYQEYQVTPSNYLYTDDA